MRRVAEIIEDFDMMDFNFCCDLAVLILASEAIVDASNPEVHVPDFGQGGNLIWELKQRNVSILHILLDSFVVVLAVRILNELSVLLYQLFGVQR